MNIELYKELLESYETAYIDADGVLYLEAGNESSIIPLTDIAMLEAILEHSDDEAGRPETLAESGLSDTYSHYRVMDGSLYLITTYEDGSCTRKLATGKKDEVLNQSVAKGFIHKKLLEVNTAIVKEGKVKPKRIRPTPSQRFIANTKRQADLDALNPEADSLEVSKRLGIQHSKFMAKVAKAFVRVCDDDVLIESCKVTKLVRGKEVTVYIMTLPRWSLILKEMETSQSPKIHSNFKSKYGEYDLAVNLILEESELPF